MEEAKTLVVDIVTWNSRPYLPNVFESFGTQTSRDFTVTVVDNASHDGTVSWLQEARPSVTVLRNFRNQGFARGHNQGIALALSRWPEAEWPRRYVLVANPDLELAPECIGRLIAAMDADPGLAACAPKLLTARAVGQDEGRMVTERTNAIDSTGLQIAKSRRVTDRGAGEEDRGQYDGRTDVFGFSGACVCFRASALVDAKLGGEFFDEDFFAYREDVDLAWRMRRLGMRARLVPDAIAWHVRTAAPAKTPGLFAAWKNRSRRPPHITFFSTRNQSWTVWKNDELWNAMCHAPWVAAHGALLFLASFFSWSTFRGNVAATAGGVKMWKKRRELSRRARVSGRDMRKWFV